MRVPDGWFDYSRFGFPIDATRIIAIKTPLKKAFNTGQSARHADYQKGVPLEEEFTPLQMVRQFRERGWEVGLVIDLTFTDRYYEPREFAQQGVKHLKIKCPGHIIPPDNVYMELCSGINEFLSNSRNSGALVAVHCTHGLNRTGYLVCRYLIEYCGYDMERAVQAFNRGRGHDIERENYLDHLREGCPNESSSAARGGSQSVVASNYTRGENGGVRDRHSRGVQEREEEWTDMREHVNYQRHRHTPRVRDESPGVGVWEGDLRTKLRQKRARGGLEGHTHQHHHTDETAHRKQNRSHYQWRERGDERGWAQGYDDHHAPQPTGFYPYPRQRKRPHYNRDGESVDRSTWRGEQSVSAAHYQQPLQDHGHHRRPPHVDSVDAWVGGYGYDPGYQEQQGLSSEWSRRRKGRKEQRFF